MRLILFLVTFLFISNTLMAQFNYEDHWKKVADADQKGLPKTASEEVNKIYAQALKDHLEPQVLKSLIYRVKYNNQLEDQSYNATLALLTKDLSVLSGPAASIVQSMKGEMLWGYLQQHRYQMGSRTAMASDTSSDIDTWDQPHLNRAITAAYKASIANAAALQKVNISDYDTIISKGQNSRNLRPTLYDLLTHRALDYFKSGESTLTKPADQFELTDPAAFAPASAFAAHNFKTTDTVSLQYEALLLLQELTHYHAHDKASLLDVEQERVAYAYQVGVMANKEVLYTAALKRLETDYAGEPGLAAVYGMLANYYLTASRQSGEKVANGTLTPAQAVALAKSYCEKGIQIAKDSRDGNQCWLLLQNINARNLGLQTELVNLPDKAFRSLVTYQNLSKIYLRIVRVDETFKQLLRDAQSDYKDYDRYWRTICQRSPLHSWEQALPGADDQLEHKAEIKIDAPPLGQYMVLASLSPDFTLTDNLLAMQFVHVSNIAYLNSDSSYYTVHRETGKPLAGVKLNLWIDKGQRKLLKGQSAETDADGMLQLKLKAAEKSRGIRYEWINGADTLFTDNYAYLYSYDRYNNADNYEEDTYLFTDRAIYRPGQTVYFKGIKIARSLKTTDHKVKAGVNVTITLRDPNGEDVDTLTFTTNEYGSFSGKMTLPVGRLNGQYILNDDEGDRGAVEFSVEEYKRPKFYVEFDKVQGSYRVGDTVKISGKALAYAGNNIDGAKVTYRVQRKARFPYYWLMSKRPYSSAQREISQGTLTTGIDGSFSISFPALPDLAVSPDVKPVFTYAVYVDVTDINGETRSGSESVSAGYQALELSLNLPGQLQQADLQKVAISTKNLNGVFESAKVKVTVKAVQHPDHLIRRRYWEEPDQFTMSATEYRQYFPTDVYKDEDIADNWQRGATIFTQDIQTVKDSTVNLLHKLNAGWYEILVSTTDKYGQEVVDKKTFELVDPAARKLSYPDYFWHYEQSGSYEPGQKADYFIASGVPDAHVLQVKNNLNEKPVLSSFNIGDNITNKSVKVEERDRGNIVFSYLMVRDNRTFALVRYVYVPWSNKDLDIHIATHRDKLLPGENEKWQVQIKGKKGDQVAAEMLATMYDASLDAFRKHNWQTPQLYPDVTGSISWNDYDNFKFVSAETKNSLKGDDYPSLPSFSYDQLNWFGADPAGFSPGGVIRMRGISTGMAGNVRMSAVAQPAMDAALPAPALMAKKVAGEPEEKESNKLEGTVVGVEIKPDAAPAEKVQPRTNFSETAFFFPDLHTDKDGNISFEFAVPEALTRWRFMSFAHTMDLSFGYAESSVLTQKPLMVQPNAPRFMREGDKITFTAKISNLADSALTGEARLELLDATTMQPVDGWFQNVYPAQHFTVEKGQSVALSFPLEIPYKFNSSLLYRITAQSGRYSDGEENALPVLTNTMLVTESMPLAMRGDGTRNFKMDKLLHSDSSETLQQHKFTVEFTGNPAWYAVQALPYLMEYPYECAEQVFNRYYANTLASYISNALPGVKAIFDKWRTADTAALQSNLQKNEELKTLLLQETPWVMEAKNEAEQKQRIALLFDLNRMGGEQAKALAQLQQKQLPSGAFPWFTGMWEDRYITQYIVAGVGRLQQVGALYGGNDEMITKALQYLDRSMDASYHELKKWAGKTIDEDHLDYITAHYLYMRSMFKSVPLSAMYRTAYNYYLSQAKKYWLKKGVHAQAMLAIALHANNDDVTAKAIMRSLKENAIVNEEMGMYWKNVRSSYWWYEAPIETQSMLIAAFEQVTHDTAAVADMKTWLLKNKQTNNWNTTKATADACYAMLMGSSNWLAATPTVSITTGNVTINAADEKTEAGTGYFKKQFEAKDVKPAMGNITVTLNGSHGQPAWGAVYWQYFEQLDKITAAETPLVLQKQLFIEKNTNSGPQLTAIEDGNELKVGDKVKVRVVIKADRDMEYVHLRDMRAACFEPLNVISSSGYQNGVSYYQSTKDVSTDFFFSRLPKGTYVFEYGMFVTHQGNYSNGISIAQCMYAPEFSAHSDGIRVKVKE